MYRSLVTLSSLLAFTAAAPPSPPSGPPKFPGPPTPPGQPGPIGPPAAPPAPPPGPPLPPPGGPSEPLKFPYFENATVFTPPASWSDHSTSYARNVLLNQNCEEDDVLLSTWTQGAPDGPYFPIYKSTNGGQSWNEISKLYFTHANYSGGIILQPFLFELPIAYGKYPAGTVLATGNAIPATFDSTNIELYASLDKGYNWEYVSTVATGAGPNTTNGAHPIWEPFIMNYKDDIVVYYSDQRDPLHGQKLAHQTSTDLLSWGPVVNDIAYGNYTLRPGMTTVAQLGNGKYMLSYELAFAPEDAIRAPYAVHYVIAENPLEFQYAPYNLLNATDGTIPSACPYTVWTPAGGPNGTIVLSDGTYDELFLNTKLGDPSAWERVASGHGVGYTRALRVMPGGGENTILVQNGGMYGASYTIVSTGDFSVPGPGSRTDTISACKGKGWSATSP